MDERAISVVFLLLAGVLPLRSLGDRWAGNPGRRGLYRALVALYVSIAIIAALALARGRDLSDRRSPSSSDQLARAEARVLIEGLAWRI